MKYAFVLAASLAALASTPAFAQEFTGVRVEGRVGWEQSKVDATLPNPDAEEDEDAPEFISTADKDSSVNYGFELGYDYQIGSSVVLGAYAGADFSGTDNCMELVGDDLACASLKRTFTIGARAGVPIADRALVYIKGGYSNGKFDGSYDFDVTDNDDEEPGEILYASDKLNGYHLGAGVEVAITRNVYAKAEYVYTDYGSGSTDLDDEDDAMLHSSASRHQVLAGVGFRF